MLPFQQIRMIKGYKTERGALSILSSMTEATVIMCTCRIVEEHSKFKLIAEVDENSVLLVTSLDMFQKFIACELVTNISIEYIYIFK